MHCDISEISPVERSLDDLLKNRYPDFQERCEVPLIDLLEWELGPKCIRRYGLFRSYNYRVFYSFDTNNYVFQYFTL